MDWSLWGSNVWGYGNDLGLAELSLKFVLMYTNSLTITKIGNFSRIHDNIFWNFVINLI